MTTEREKCAEILARHLEGRLQSKEALLNALLEARDLARREALEEAANVIEGWESLWKEALADIRFLISQPSPETPSASVPAEPDSRIQRAPLGTACPNCGAQAKCYANGDYIIHDIDCRHLTPPDTEAWERVDDDALMALIRRYFDKNMQRAMTRTVCKVGFDVDYPTLAVKDFAAAIERAARAKLVEK